eukprot:3307244-Rhodomonas_salina.1
MATLAVDRWRGGRGAKRHCARPPARSCCCRLLLDVDDDDDDDGDDNDDSDDGEDDSADDDDDDDDDDDGAHVVGVCQAVALLAAGSLSGTRRALLTLVADNAGPQSKTTRSMLDRCVFEAWSIAGWCLMSAQSVLGADMAREWWSRAASGGGGAADAQRRSALLRRRTL